MRYLVSFICFAALLAAALATSELETGAVDPETKAVLDTQLADLDAAVKLHTRLVYPGATVKPDTSQAEPMKAEEERQREAKKALWEIAKGEMKNAILGQYFPGYFMAQYVNETGVDLRDEDIKPVVDFVAPIVSSVCDAICFIEKGQGCQGCKDFAVSLNGAVKPEEYSIQTEKCDLETRAATRAAFVDMLSGELSQTFGGGGFMPGAFIDLYLHEKRPVLCVAELRPVFDIIKDSLGPICNAICDLDKDAACEKCLAAADHEVNTV